MAKSRANGAGAKKEANAKLASIITDLDRGEYYDERAGKIAFGVVAREHIRLAEIRESARTVYRPLLRTVLAPFDVVPIGSITAQSVERWWRENDSHPSTGEAATFSCAPS